MVRRQQPIPKSPFEPGCNIDRETGCKWVTWHSALKHFAVYCGPTQSQGHIKPLHWYTACRLVYEGGFHPDEIIPHPPFEVDKRSDGLQLLYNPERGTWNEATVFGGLKTKNVDVVVIKPGIGPVLAVSHKGVTGAFRNLTNRMEETIGDCTNLHIAYPALVFGYQVTLRGNRTAQNSNDRAFDNNGQPVEEIRRFHAALVELARRQGIRDDPSRYEAIALTMVETTPESAGEEINEYPNEGSPLHFRDFFETLYRKYDERYVYGAPALKTVTSRIEWSPASPAIRQSINGLDYGARIKA